MKILIIKFRNIGDVLLSTPLLENLKHHYPDAQIDFALNAGCQDMISANPNIRNIFIYDRNKIKQKCLPNRIKDEIVYIKNIILNKYDLVINLTEGDRGAILSLLSKAKQKLGFAPRKGILRYLNIYDITGDDQKSIHTVEKDLQFMLFLGGENQHKRVSIYWEKSNIEKIDYLLNKYHIKEFIHIHPVSRWMFKCWENDRMAKVIDYLQETKKIKVIITAAPDKIELQRVEQIISLCKTTPINFSGQLSLKDMAYLSSKAKLFFGTDTAPMHIAAAVDTPVIALFGASHPVLWGPWDNSSNGTKFQYINGIQKSGIHSIISDIDHTIYYENGIKKSQGMTNIKYKDVIDIFNDYV